MQQELQKHVVHTLKPQCELTINRPLLFDGVDANIVSLQLSLLLSFLGVNEPSHIPTGYTQNFHPSYYEATYIMQLTASTFGFV